MVNNRYRKGAEIPSEMGAVIDEFKHVKDLRLKMDKQVSEVKARETELENFIIDSVSKSQSGGAVGKYYTGKIVNKTVPQAENWSEIHAYIDNTKRFDLLNKSLSKKAVEDMWADGVEIPGVGRFNKISLSVTKN